MAASKLATNYAPTALVTRPVRLRVSANLSGTGYFLIQLETLHRRHDHVVRADLITDQNRQIDRARSTKTLATILGRRQLDSLAGSATVAACSTMGYGRRTAIATIGIIDAGNTISMTDSEHQKFIDSILKKHNLSVEIPVFSSPQYLEKISVFFKEPIGAYRLLAMSMASRVVDQSHRTADYEPLIFLSESIRLNLPTTGSNELEVTAQEVRSALFWGFLRTGHKNLRLLDAECQLLAVICGGSFESIRLADAALTQGVHLIK